MSSPWGQGQPAALLSVQVPLAEHVFVEAEATRLTLQHGDDVTTAAVNLLFNVRSKRVSWFTGAGLGVQRTTRQPVRHSMPFACAPADSSSCQLLVSGRDSGVILQALGGGEIWFTPRVGAFAAVQAGTAPEQGIRAVAGIRTGLLLKGPTLQAPTPSPVTGTEQIRVTLTNGARQTGRLVSHSETQVEFAMPDKPPTVLPLKDVRKIETVSHHARTGALIGASAGAVMLALAYTGDCADCEDRRVAFFFPGVFGGIGAAVGGMINVATAHRHLLYETGSKSLSLQPALSLGGAGVRMSVAW